MFITKIYMNLKYGITLESRKSISTPMRSPLCLTLLASQNRSSRTSTVDEQRLDFRSARMTYELGIILSIVCSKIGEDDVYGKKTYLFICKVSPPLRVIRGIE